jgi:hypothetical protein
MLAIIVAAANADTDTLMEVLQQAGVDEAWIVGNHASDTLLDDFSPDMVIGVLQPELPPIMHGVELQRGGRAPRLSNLDVMLRVGRSIGRSCQALVIAPPPLQPPAPTALLFVATCPADDRKSLELHVWAFISGISNRQDGVKKTNQPGGYPERTPEMSFASAVHRLKAIGSAADKNPSVRAYEIEQLVVEMLQRAGAELAENPYRHEVDFGFDAAIVPAKSSGSVYLVEVKSGRLDRRKLVTTAERLQGAVISRGADLGLLIYQDVVGRVYSGIAVPGTIAINAASLGRLDDISLTQLVAEELAAAAGSL